MFNSKVLCSLKPIFISSNFFLVYILVIVAQTLLKNLEFEKKTPFTITQYLNKN